MKIAFICGSLEVGEDGVGDYTSILAELLAKKGHTVLCVAINDKCVAQSSCYSKTTSTKFAGCFQTIRFSSFTEWKVRFKLLSSIIQAMRPDWVSLQYVPYSFSSKGLPFVFTIRLNEIRGTWRWHIMFHELWIGRENSLTAHAVSIAQELLIKFTSVLLRPTVIHTSIEVYRSMLARIGITSAILPLHSNIPVFRSYQHKVRDKNYWTFLFFGSLNSQWQPEPFFSLVEAGRRLGLRQGCLFISLGRKGERGKKLWNAWSSSQIKRQYPAFDFQEVGFCSVYETSIWLQKANFGISMAPMQWIGKSGSVAAMVQHGLPVIVPTYQTELSNLTNDDFLSGSQFLPIDNSLPNNLCLATRFATTNRANQTANILLSSLM